MKVDLIVNIINLFFRVLVSKLGKSEKLDLRNKFSNLGLSYTTLVSKA
jgi:hypothetical protein